MPIDWDAYEEALYEDIVDRMADCHQPEQEKQAAAHRVAKRLLGEELKRAYVWEHTTIHSDDHPDYALRDADTKEMILYIMNDEIHIDSAWYPELEANASGIGHTLRIKRTMRWPPKGQQP